MAISPRDCIPKDWTRLLGGGPLGLGYDIATTDKETSNPSSLTVTERVGPLFVQRLVLRWKTKHEAVAKAMLKIVFQDLEKLKIRPRRLCVDGSNERFFAQSVQSMFSMYCPVQIIVSGETLMWHGEKLDYKTVLGSVYKNTFEDGLMRCPDAKWLKDDHRLVKKQAGRFVTDTAADGSHGDTFDSGKLAHYALLLGGRAEISATAVGQINQAKSLPAGLRNPLLKLAEQQRRKRSNI